MCPYLAVTLLVSAAALLSAIVSSQGQGQVQICRGDELAHAVIRTCSGARSLIDEPDQVLTTTEATTTSPPDHRRAKLVARLESLLDILYVAVELGDNGLLDTPRRRRSAVETAPSGSGLDDSPELRSISQSDLRMALRARMMRLMVKCCRQSCNAHDFAQVCPSSRLYDQ